MNPVKKTRKKRVLVKDKPSNIAPKKTPDEKTITYKYFDQYRDLYSFMMKPVSETFVDKLAEDLIAWARDDKDALILSQFFYIKGIGYDMVQKWSHKHEKLAMAFSEAKRLIGNRREVGAVKKHFEPGMVKTSMRMYHKEWEDIEKARAELKQQQDELTSKRNIQWVLEKYPETSIVPKKTKDQGNNEL